MSEVWDNPALGKDENSFLIGLEEFLANRRDISVVLPIAEEFVNFFATKRWSPHPRTVLASPNHTVVQKFTDKVEALRLANRLHVPTVPFERVENRRELLDAAVSIGFPITVRPLGTTARIGLAKALIADGAEQLAVLLPEWPADKKYLLLQRYAEGPRHNIFFAAAAGKLLAVAEGLIRRTNYPHGTGLAVSGETVPLTQKLVGDTERLVADCGYTGIGLAQFIFNSETGERCFLELNPRVSGSHAVPERSGVPLTAMAVALALGEPVPVPEPYLQGRTGIRYTWTTGEIIGLKASLRSGETGLGPTLVTAAAALRDALFADADMIWSWDDPKPGLRAFWHLVPRPSRRGRRARRRGPQVGRHVS